MKTYLTIKDNIGIIRLRAEVWEDDESGLEQATKYQKKDSTISIVRVTVVEIETVIEPTNV